MNNVTLGSFGHCIDTNHMCQYCFTAYWYDSLLVFQSYRIVKENQLIYFQRIFHSLSLTPIIVGTRYE